MLNHPTLDQLKAMRLTGMAQAFEEQLHDSNVDALSFDDRLAFLVEREHTLRSNRQLANRLRRAKLKLQATLEDLDFHARRGLDKTRIRELANSRFIKDHLNVLITGPTGVGKTYLACAIAHSACRNGFTARYLRLPRLLHDIGIARGDGSYPRFLTQLAKTDLIESRRDSRRPKFLRGLGHEQANKIFPGSTGTCGADGVRASGGAHIAVGHDQFDFRQDWLYARDIA